MVGQKFWSDIFGGGMAKKEIGTGLIALRPLFNIFLNIL